jgi:transcription elongation factor GreA
MEKIILTEQGFHLLQQELELLKSTKRKEAADALEKARAHGDLRENAEYDAAKQNKANLEARIATLEDRLSRAKVVDVSEIPTDKIYFGITAELKNGKTGKNVKFTFVAEDEADINKGKISISSPIGKQLLGHKVGETVNVNVPAGIIPFTILSISR